MGFQESQNAGYVLWSRGLFHKKGKPRFLVDVVTVDDPTPIIVTNFIL